MRLWSIHPSYLDAKGLVAQWREGLLARKVLLGQTKGYKNHPQLMRFKDTADPIAAIDAYLAIVVDEALQRSYHFDETKILKRKDVKKIRVTSQQLAHELEHLKKKLEVRAKDRLHLLNEGSIRQHPLFSVIDGPIEPWEILPNSTKKFSYNHNFNEIDFRRNPEKYTIGRGEQGVLLVEPYKSEILPYWRFKTPEIAKKSASKIYSLFLNYKKRNDFIGMDMARKFLQMGFTRARRYANHPSGRKYESNPQLENSVAKEIKARKKILPQAADWETNQKAKSAGIFYDYYVMAREDKTYKTMKSRWGK